MKKSLYIQSEKEADYLNLELKQMLKSGAVDITYRPHGRSKSLEQLGYYFGCILPHIKTFLLEQGNEFDIDEIDTMLKNKFMSVKKFNPFTASVEKIVYGKRTATIKEMSAFIENVLRYTSDSLGLYIPSSEEYIIKKQLGI